MKHCVLAALLLTACGKNEKPPPKVKNVAINQESGPGGSSATPGGAKTPEEKLAASAQTFYASVCANCHGMDGTGNTPLGSTFDPPPRNYTVAAWQASVADDDIKNIILKGSKAVGKSAGMPPHEGMLADKPGVLDGLVKIVRGFKK